MGDSTVTSEFRENIQLWRAAGGATFNSNVVHKFSTIMRLCRASEPVKVLRRFQPHCMDTWCTSTRTTSFRTFWRAQGHKRLMTRGHFHDVSINIQHWAQWCIFWRQPKSRPRVTQSETCLTDLCETGTLQEAHARLGACVSSAHSSISTIPDSDNWLHGACAVTKLSGGLLLVTTVSLDIPAKSGSTPAWKMVWCVDMWYVMCVTCDAIRASLHIEETLQRRTRNAMVRK